MSPAASTRWCPTPEQVMILEEMYRSGVRTPNAAQIQQITAHLSLYGKIEGKNVFYWFQNHKARDRQKLRKKLLGKQLQQHQHQQQIMFSHHIFPTFDPHHHHHQQQQHFQHYPNHQNNNSLLHHLHFDQPPPPPTLPLPPPPTCFGPTSSSSLGLFHHQLPSVNPSPYLGAHQTRAEDAVPQMANSGTWKMETTSEAKYARDNKKRPMMRMFTNNDHHDDWMMMMMRSRDHHHHHDNDDSHDYYYHDDENSSTKPIKTLELFPIKDKTSLKEDLSYV